MTDFDVFFNAEVDNYQYYKDNKILPGEPIRYKGILLLRYEKLRFQDGDEIEINIESTNSDWKQGISLDLFGYFEFHDGNRHKDGTILWEDTCPKNVVLKLWSEKKKRYKSKYLPEKKTLTLSNAWDKGDGAIWTEYWGSAMKVEEIEHGRRYYCSDGKPDANFSNIIFTVKKFPENSPSDWWGSLEDDSLPTYD